MPQSVKERYELAIEDQRAAVQRAIDRGGLPTEEDLDHVYKTLGMAHDVLEGIAVRVEGISESPDGSDLPFQVTLEHLGVLAVVASDAKRLVEDISGEVAKIESSISSLEAIRQEQKTRKGNYGTISAYRVISSVTNGAVAHPNSTTSVLGDRSQCMAS